jgi:hypothetical protein
LAGGGVGRGGGVRRVMSAEERKMENAEIIKAARQISGIRDLSLSAAREMIQREGGLQSVQTQLLLGSGFLAGGGAGYSRASQAQAAQAALAGQIGRSKGVQKLARRAGFFEAAKEEVKGFSLFD